MKTRFTCDDVRAMVAELRALLLNDRLVNVYDLAPPPSSTVAAPSFSERVSPIGNAFGHVSGRGRYQHRCNHCIVVAIVSVGRDVSIRLLPPPCLRQRPLSQPTAFFAAGFFRVFDLCERRRRAVASLFCFFMIRHFMDTAAFHLSTAMHLT